MTTTPNLPTEFRSRNEIPVERATILRERMDEIQLVAYQAGRDAGLEEAEQVCDNRAMDRERATNNCDDPADIAELRSGAWILSDCARSIRAMKSGTKEASNGTAL